MVIRALVGFLAVGELLLGCAAPPPPPVPVCAQPGVLRQVDETIRRRGQELVIDAPPVGEVSAGADLERSEPGLSDRALDHPPLARCAVRGHTVGYDTNRYGASPVHEAFTVRYTVELRHNGMFVAIE